MAIVDVIKYDGNPDVFAWKYPNSELGTWSQLIVHESQEAILFKGGKVCDVFQAGRHTLSTENIPVLNKLVNLPFGKRSPFSAEVWFVNKVFSLDVKWGTSTPIQLQDPKYNIFIPVRAFGQFGIRIEDSHKFLVKLMGNLPQLDKSHLVKYFRGVYLTRAKDAISSYLIHENISILEINAYLDEISSFLLERIRPTFEEYGIRLVSFYVNDINVPEEDQAVKKLKQALAKKAEMDIVGYNYQQERSFDTLEGAATNPGSMQSGLMGAGIGLGVGAGVGSMVGQQFGGLSNTINTSRQKQCPKCHASIEQDVRFCKHCGHDTTLVEQAKDMMKCVECGAKINENSKFCIECGTPVGKQCEKCGVILPKNSKFCPECGQSVVNQCPNCQATLDANAKFCPECGTSTR